MCEAGSLAGQCGQQGQAHKTQYGAHRTGASVAGVGWLVGMGVTPVSVVQAHPILVEATG